MKKSSLFLAAFAVFLALPAAASVAPQSSTDQAKQADQVADHNKSGRVGKGYCKNGRHRNSSHCTS